MAHHHHRLTFVARGSRHDGVIVGETAIAVQLNEIGEEPNDVVEHVGPAWMARHEHALPRGELGVDLRSGVAQLLVQPLQLALAWLGSRQRRERIDFLQQRRQ